jgi:hypothetical protein
MSRKIPQQIQECQITMIVWIAILTEKKNHFLGETCQMGLNNGDRKETAPYQIK